jgi:hypothetical protein
VSQVGLVYYLDDPEQKVFRKVFPSDDDSELDDPQWVTLGCDPARRAVLIKVPSDSDAASGSMTGMP